MYEKCIISFVVHVQVFLPVAKYKGTMVAVRKLRKERVKIDRKILVEMRQVNDR